MSAGTKAYNQVVVTDTIVTGLRSRLGAELAAPVARYRPFVVDDANIGWIDDDHVARLAEFTGVLVISAQRVTLAAALQGAHARTLAMDRVARALAAHGCLTPWRDERYAVAPAFGAQPCFDIERAAARFFGIHTFAAHINGVVRAPGEVRMWLARRSVHKAIDPGLLDNFVGGGIGTGASVESTVIKEAAEEAGVPPELASAAQPAGTVHICRARADGLQRETIFVHDLDVPASFVPTATDGEVSAFRLDTLAHAAQLAAASEGPDVVTTDASLVIVDFLLRHGAFPAQAPDVAGLGALRYPAMTPSRVAG
ncbi:MAG: DUF4743 domain-containing protein [Casimicrobiaceae bacterium]